MCVLLILDDRGERLFAERFRTIEQAQGFLENTIAFFLNQRAEHVVLRDESDGVEMKYRADGVAEGLPISPELARALS